MDVSCICVTYGRRELLQESIQMFLDQDFKGEAELVILNDEEGVEYYIDDEISAQNVRVVNSETRYSSIGSKRTAATNMAEGRIIIPWDDDDIILPNKISSIESRMKDNDYFQCRGGYTITSQGVVLFVRVLGHMAAGFLLSTFKKLGGAYVDRDYREDIDLKDRFAAQAKYHDEDIPEEEVFFICRRSPEAAYQTTHLDIGNRHEEIRRLSEKVRITGRVKLTPGLKQDYLSIYRKKK